MPCAAVCAPEPLFLSSSGLIPRPLHTLTNPALTGDLSPASALVHHIAHACHPRQCSGRRRERTVSPAEPVPLHVRELREAGQRRGAALAEDGFRVDGRYDIHAMG